MGKFILRSFLSALVMLMIVGCGGGGSTESQNNTDETPSTSTGTGKVVGSIINYSNGNGLAGAVVKAGNSETVTGADGSFTLSGIAIDLRAVVTVSSDNFATTSKIVTLTSERTEVNLDIRLLPVAFSDNFNPENNFVAQVPDSSARVSIGAGTLVDATGKIPTGSIKAELTPINPALDITLMPGDMTVSSGDPIASYGAMTVEFTDASENALNLAAGETASIRIPVANRGETAPPATIPLYYFDEAQGFWVEEGTARLSAAGTYYEGTVGHFSTWNADELYDNVSIHGCVNDENGVSVTNALVSMVGFDYNGWASAYTDSKGDFTVTAMKDGTSLLTAVALGKVSNTVKESTPTDKTLSDCLVLGAGGDVSLTVRLTWGESPLDLDTHLIGDDGYHIWYWSQGSLSTEPFANLDVDDVTSYGPEVLTALRFSAAGTYHYAVHNYSRYENNGIAPGMTASPARVELTFDGKTMVFTPPVGEGSSTRWWNVFDIIVDDNGHIRIKIIDTWATSANGPIAEFNLGKSVMPAKIKK